jgi:hypothetical protein
MAILTETIEGMEPEDEIAEKNNIESVSTAEIIETTEMENVSAAEIRETNETETVVASRTNY